MAKKADNTGMDKKRTATSTTYTVVRRIVNWFKKRK